MWRRRYHRSRSFAPRSLFGVSSSIAPCDSLSDGPILSGALSFHAVAFGPSNAVLLRMVELATEVQRRAPADPLRPAVPSSYNEAIDSVRLKTLELEGVSTNHAADSIGRDILGFG